MILSGVRFNFFKEILAPFISTGFKGIINNIVLHYVIFFILLFLFLSYFTKRLIFPLKIEFYLKQKKYKLRSFDVYKPYPMYYKIYSILFRVLFYFDSPLVRFLNIDSYGISLENLYFLKSHYLLGFLSFTLAIVFFYLVIVIAKSIYYNIDHLFTSENLKNNISTIVIASFIRSFLSYHYPIVVESIVWINSPNYFVLYVFLFVNVKVILSRLIDKNLPDITIWKLLNYKDLKFIKYIRFIK